ncbi:5-formyltetrahydrofolate cyclo-ligase [Candidatus Woesearchaeota archaeon]|nr:5-formyltetrahydrofolate cyclo-ligase [Candidatus Woesearchaeota archaeon]
MALGSEFKKIKKDGLRPYFLDVRNRLGKGFVHSRSLQVQKRFSGLVEYSEADTIMFYCSTGNEVETRKAIGDALKLKKRVVLPVCDIYMRMMKPVQFGRLKKGPLGIPEPSGKEINIDEIDIVVVPVVSFDEECDRLGRGLGYYDNFLRGLKAVKVGFAFDCLKTDNVPREDHDIQLDKIVTESRVIVAKK